MTESVLDENIAKTTPRDMRAFLTIWFGQLISMLGSGLTRFALGVWIFAETGQATPFAITVLLGNLPGLLLMPVAGSLADRWNRRRIMILADTGSALLTLMIAFFLFQGDLMIWHIYILVTLGSVCSAFQEPAYSASIVMLVPKEKLGNANGMVQMGQALASVITPLLAGALFVSIGLNGIILIDFVTFFFAVGALFLIHIPQPVQTKTEHKASNLWSDIRFGWDYLRQRPGLFGLLMYYAMVNFLLNWSGVLITPMVLTSFSPSILGVIQTALGVGMLAGSIIMSSWGGPKRRIPAVIGFISLAWIGFLIAGLRPHPFYIGAGLFILMFFIPLASGNSQVVFQSKVAPEVQGRVFSIRSMMSQSMMPLAFVTAGPLADYVFEPLMKDGGALADTFVGGLLGTGPGRGIGLMFVVAGAVALIVSAFVYANPRIRNVEDEIPDSAAS
ncbi:MAG: MFS transporter [Anaerolineales bacterium]|nr:MFS transporter [Anaerolineales bacterium]